MCQCSLYYSKLSFTTLHACATSVSPSQLKWSSQSKTKMLKKSTASKIKTIMFDHSESAQNLKWMNIQNSRLNTIFYFETLQIELTTIMWSCNISSKRQNIKCLKKEIILKLVNTQLWELLQSHQVASMSLAGRLGLQCPPWPNRPCVSVHFIIQN